jgi:tetratricopeptide (TPR) repeat protein
LALHQRSRNIDDHRVRDNNLALLLLMVKDMLANELFSEARDLCDRFGERFRAEAGFGQIYRMIYSRWGLYHWQRQEWDRTLDVLEEELAFVPDDDQEYGRLLERMADCYLNRGASALQGNDWQQAIGLYLEGFSWAQANAPARIAEFRKSVAVSYQGRALSNFNRGNWSAAVDDFVSQKAWADESGMRSSINRNLQAAFNNWKTDYLRKGDLAGAKGVLEECTERLPALKLCREQLGALENIHPR